MALIAGGVSGALLGVGLEASSPAHFVAKPTPYGNLGHYRVARRYALINSQAAGAILVAARNISANPVIVKRLYMRLLQTSAPTAAIEARISATIARGYSVSDSTNGTLLTLSGNNAKKRTSMATPGLEIRETTVAAGATGGTKVLDADAFMKMSLWELLAVPTGGPVPEVTREYSPNVRDGEHPFLLAQNEGFVITNDAVLGAAAAGILYYEIDWVEATTY
jgi:hypothetical protein